MGNILAVIVIPFVGNLSDKIGRRPCIIVGALGSGLLSFVYLYAISIHNVWMAVATSLVMWGMVYQGWNAVYPSFYPELFQTKYRVSAMAIGQNIGTAVSALLPAVFATVASPGSTNVPLRVGSITFGVCVLAAIAAMSAKETYRIHLNDLGKRDAVPVPKEEYDLLRVQTLAGGLAKA
jgi:MFS family permease